MIKYDENMATPFNQSANEVNQEQKMPYFSDGDWEEIIELDAGMKNLFSVSIPAAKLRNEPLNSLLIIGADEKLFKAFTQKVADAMDTGVKLTKFDKCKKTKGLLSAFPDENEKDIVAIWGNFRKWDEDSVRCICSAITDNVFDMRIGRGSSENIIHIDLPQFTYILGCNSKDCIRKGIRYSVETVIDFRSIPEEVIRKIEIRRFCKIYHLKISDSLLHRLSYIAIKNQCTSRELVGFLSNYMCINQLGDTVSTEIVDNVFGEYTELNQSESISTCDGDDYTEAKFADSVMKLFSKMGYVSGKIEYSNGKCDMFTANQHGIKIGVEVIHADCETIEVSTFSGILNYVREKELDKGVVVTDKLFSHQAMKQAQASRIALWDRNVLNDISAEYDISW